jgi:hypothetical protein
MAEKEKDWADRRAEAFYAKVLLVETTGRQAVILEKLAENFRDLAGSCEPRSSLDM